MISRFDTVLAQARAGSFDDVWRDLARPVSGFLRTRGVHHPGSVTSEVFLAVFSSLARFQGDQHQFRSWASTIAHRQR